MIAEGSLGARPGADGASFRVWAPKPATLALVVRDGAEEQQFPVSREADGYASARVAGIGAGARYGYLVDGQGPFPDPCSRSQPDGPHGLSEVIDPAAFAWTDSGWKRPDFTELVIYECHIGTFTPAGTFEGAIAELPRLRQLGVTAIELMPVASFPGRWGWGYDGVALFAPFHEYGGPEGLRCLVDAAHGEGLAVILDVVYNHFGPDGNYTGLYSADYVASRHHTPWGDAINFDGPNSREVRHFYRENLLHWLREYHIDGFRFDATHAIFDDSPTHILAELATAVAETHRGRGRPPYLIAESHENDIRYITTRSNGGFGFDAVWADDFHHAVRTLLLGEREGYLRGYRGTAGELALTISQGFFYEGQLDRGFGGPRGTPARKVPWSSFVYSIQNHDQIGNHPFGERLNVTAALSHFRAATVLLLLLPQTPMLFQGQEWLTTTPFLYFSDHHSELGRLVTEGRRREFAGFRAFNHPETRELIPDPQAESTFQSSVIDSSASTAGAGALAAAFHRELLQLRRSDPVLREYRHERLPLEVSVVGDCLTITLTSRSGRRWIVANFGKARRLRIPGAAAIIFDSTDGRFGGRGLPPVLNDERLTVPRGAALLLADNPTE